MSKDSGAFRTIGEVAEALGLPQHVLRFWEAKFPQINPLKRGGGRRYYRPTEVTLLTTIRRLLYDEGYTIRGVQRLLKERGVRAVAADLEPEDDAGSRDAPEAGSSPAPHDPLRQDADARPMREPTQELGRAIGGSHPSTSDRALLAELSAELEDCSKVLAAARLAAMPDRT